MGSPCPETLHTILQVSSSLEPGVYQGKHIDVGKGMLDECLKVLGKCGKGVIASLFKQHDQSGPANVISQADVGARTLKP